MRARLPWHFLPCSFASAIFFYPGLQTCLSSHREISCRQILFAKSGFDSEKLVNQLGSIDLRATYEPLEPIHETDLEAFLAHEHEMLILTAIEEAKKTVRSVLLSRSAKQILIFCFKIRLSIGSMQRAAITW